MLSLYEFIFKKHRYLIYGLFGFALAIILFKRIDNKVYISDDVESVASKVYTTGKKNDCYNFSYYVVPCPSL